MNLIGHEFYIETLVDAWDSIFTSPLFINDVAEKIFKKLVFQESEYFNELDIQFLIKNNLEPAQVPLLELKPIENLSIAMDESYILNYIRRLFDYLSQIDFNIESVLNTSNTLDPLEMLSKMQEAEIGVMIERAPIIRILPLNLYLDLEKETNITSQIEESQHIHNKMVFDVVNECLLQKGCKPEPMP